MSKILRVGLLGLCLFVLAGCSPSDNEGCNLSQQDTADKFVREVLYIKDPTTNLCYAYYWGGTQHGGPAITVVPEASIPPGRLLIGRPNR